MDDTLNLMKGITFREIPRDYIFQYAVIASLVFHILFLGIFSLPKTYKTKKRKKSLEVVYQDLKLPTQKDPFKDVQTLKLLKESGLSDDIYLPERQSQYTPGLTDKSKDLAQFDATPLLAEKKTSDVNVIASKRKVSIPVFKSEKISNPRYLSYNENIRQKIKQRAYAYVNSPDFQAGEVYLTFVLGSDGNLQAIKIIDDRTRANAYLRRVGLRSIRESSPFPPFPKDFNYPELTFNVVISFEIEEE